MGTTFTKEEKKYFDFLLDMGFYFSIDLSDKYNLEYIRILEGDSQFVSLNKDGFIGTCMGKQIYDVCLCLEISASAIGPVEECDFPQQFEHYHTEEEKYVIFEKFKKTILDSLNYFEKHDHITGSMNEYVYNNYLSIAKQTNFIPKTMDELNQYAIKLRDKKIMSFKDYIYIISSLLIVLLMENTDINHLTLGSVNTNSNNKGLEISNIKLNNCEVISFGPSIVTKLMWSKKINDLFIACRNYFDKNSTNSMNS